MIPGGLDYLHHVGEEVRIYIHPLQGLPHPQEFLGARDLRQRHLLGPPLQPPPQDLHLLWGIGIPQPQPDQKPVQLRLRQGEGAFVPDGVLGGDDHERLGQGAGFPLGGDLSLLHGLKQGGLGFGGSAVDLVGQHDLGEDGPRAELEFAFLSQEDVGTQNVGGQ